MAKRSVHLAACLAIGSACAPPEPAPHVGPDEPGPRISAKQSPAHDSGESPADDEAPIVVGTDPKSGVCNPSGRAIRRLLRLSSSDNVASEMARIQLVQTSDAAVGRTTTFDVIQTFVGPRATTFEWEHGGTIHPINVMVEPNKLFVLFELAPGASNLCVPDGPFIRNVEGPPPSYASIAAPPPLLEVPGVEIASNLDVARALAASLPMNGAKTIGVDMPEGSKSSFETLGADGATFGFHPPLAPIQLSRGAEPTPPVTSIAVTAALRIDDSRGRIVISGSHSTPIGHFEGDWIRALQVRSELPAKDRQFQILVETDGSELKIVSTWFSLRGG